MRPSPNTKKRKLNSSWENDNRLSSPKSEVIYPDKSSFFSQAAQWNLEQDYETKPRKSRKKDKEVTRLPIKTAEGLIQHNTIVNDVKEIESDLELSNSDHSVPVDESIIIKSRILTRQEILEAKEELAKTALLLRDNDPEENVASLKKLAQLGKTSHYTIKKLALMTQLAVYIDLIPGYRIRLLSNEDRATKVSKELKKLRTYEQELVVGYQKYVQELSRLANSARDDISKNKVPSLASIAISCACRLLVSVPHFNFRGELIKILVNVLSSRIINSDFAKCLETVEKLFKEDEDGGPSLDIVTSLSKMMKAKSYRVDEGVINLFLHLRILSEFSYKGSINQVDDNTKNEPGMKRLKEKKFYRTKKERKLMRERKIVEKEFKAADANVSNKENDQIQAETLKRVFSTYFRILKLRSSNLMGAVLEGVASYAHLINQDFFGDLLEVLKDQFTSTSLEADEINDFEHEEQSQNVKREAILCIITAFTLLEGQDVAKAKASLNLDLSFFITHLYRTLYSLSLDSNIELTTKPSHNFLSSKSSLSEPTLSKINFQTTAVLVLRSLSSILTPRMAAQAVPPTRIAAFTKQILTCCLQLPEKSCTAMTTFIRQVTKLHGKKIASLWNTAERRGDGFFDPMCSEVEGSNPFAATIWEGELLKKHFSPTIRNNVKYMERSITELK